ncbi:unnamed protein product [Diamesa serratosioi]
MAVLMSYHKLVERDADNVDYHWKTVTISLIILSVVSCLVVSFSVSKLNEAFDDQCILNSRLEFMVTHTDDDVDNEDPPFTTEEPPEMPSNITDDSFNLIQSNSTDPDDGINDKSSEWSKPASCDFVIYIPIFQSCFGIIVLTMFLICGHGGKSNSQAFLPQPWRIVTPALLFFLVMFFVGMSVLVKVHKGTDVFCASFERHVPGIGCSTAMDTFMLVNYDSMVIPPGEMFKVLIAFSWIMMLSWFFAFIVMFIRIIFVIDFQLVRVTVKTLDYDKNDNDDQERKYKSVNINEHDGNDAVTQC